MFKHSQSSIAIYLALALPGVAIAEMQVSGYLKNETAIFTNAGQLTGAALGMLDNDRHEAFDLLKFQNQARLFINNEVSENTSWHADLNFIYDTEGVNSHYRGHQNYTAYDYLRELYLDTEAAGWLLRLGKQQVVWGTADGIKLLDIINPTDFRELNQDTMEDSRIPIWMLNAEHDVGDNGNIQFIIAQHEENKIPGLNGNGDAGQAFLMKGVDSLTGRVNGFLHVAPNLAQVAQSFSAAAQFGMINGSPSPLGLAPFTGMTVDGFAGMPVTATQQGIFLPNSPNFNPNNAMPGYIPLNQITQQGAPVPGSGRGNNNTTNLMAVNGAYPNNVSWNIARPTSAFEYMSNASFATFNTFSGNAEHQAATTRYRTDKPDDFDLNYGARYRGFSDSGLNFSLNYFYHYDANPGIDMSWHDAVTGQQLATELRAPGTVLDPRSGAALPDGALISRDQVPNTIDPFGSNTTTVLLRNPATNQYYGAFNPDLMGALGSNGLSSHGAELRFTEHYQRVHSLGASFDYAFDTDFAPVVVRGEFLYDKDTLQPIVDKRLLAIGDLEGALRMQKGDMFKYVLGAEVNVMKNLLVSAQFIQFINLDYQDEQRTCRSQTGISFDCSRYSGDFPTLHMGNGLAKGNEFDNFFSLFLSKPFGPSQEHRWNNIIIYEQDGGWWNRFDIEYSFKDDLIGSFEWNHYWGDENTTFGQFEDSSSLQVGLKYLF
jgi:hypothetical protein